MKEDNQSRALRIAEALDGVVDVEAIQESKRETIIKGRSVGGFTPTSGEIGSRLREFGPETGILTAGPWLVIRIARQERERAGSFPRTNVLLFLLTVLTTIVTGAFLERPELVTDFRAFIHDPLGIVLAGLPFSISLMSILLFHEFGHYLASRYHGVDVSLPYFIPAPPGLSPFGTFGAFIKSRSAFLNRKQLLDVAAAGPLSGLAVAIVVMVIGIAGSSVDSIPSDQSFMYFGESLLFRLMTFLVKGPIPDGSGLFISPVAFAGWVGILVTMFNLLPLGQLDGGHISYALFGRYQAVIAYLFILGLVIMSFFWFGWILWIFIGFILRPAHPPTVVDELPLGSGRKLVGALCILAFVICFIPVPISLA
jgi:membrane-associated protease RseP (regulator of RpoE activity)